MIKLTEVAERQRERESERAGMSWPSFALYCPPFCRRHRQPWLQMELPRWAGLEVLFIELSNVRASFFQPNKSVLLPEHMVNVMWMSSECHVNIMSHMFQFHSISTFWCVLFLRQILSSDAALAKAARRQATFQEESCIALSYPCGCTWGKTQTEQWSKRIPVMDLRWY